MSLRATVTLAATAVAIGLCAAIALEPGLASAASIHGVPLPSGSRSADDDDDNLYRSGRGFRKTVRFYQKFLKRRGLLHDEVPVYEYRGTTVARFISKQRGAEWAAIHVFKKRGQTMIYIVPADPEDPALTSEDSQGKEATP